MRLEIDLIVIGYCGIFLIGVDLIVRLCPQCLRGQNYEGQHQQKRNEYS
jgi:hypothetical protein